MYLYYIFFTSDYAIEVITPHPLTCYSCSGSWKFVFVTFSAIFRLNHALPVLNVGANLVFGKINLSSPKSLAPF